MKKENILLVLWIIFGFVFVMAIDSILYFIMYLLYFGISELGVSYEIIKYFMPITTLILYILTALLMYKRITLRSNSTGIYLTTFPKKLFIGLALIALFLNPLTNFLSQLYITNAVVTMEMNKTYETLEVHSWMLIANGWSRWLVLVILAILFLRKLNKIENQA